MSITRLLHRVRAGDPYGFPSRDGGGAVVMGGGSAETEGLREGLRVFDGDGGAGCHGGEHGVGGVAEDEEFLGGGGVGGERGDVLDGPFEGFVDEFEHFDESVQKHFWSEGIVFFEIRYFDALTLDPSLCNERMMERDCRDQSSHWHGSFCSGTVITMFQSSPPLIG